MADYGNERLGPACLGMLADTSEYNIDGACVVADGEKVYAGTAVSVVGIVDGMKIIKTIGANEVPHGIALRDPLGGFLKVTSDTEDYPHYEAGDVCSMVTHGRVWSVCTKDYSGQFGDKAKISAFVGLISNDGVETGWPLAGGRISYNTDVDLIEVQVLQNANIVVVKVPVTGATLSANKTSPQPNDAPVQFSVDVQPANATDKTGVWSVDQTSIASIDQNGLVTPVGGSSFGNFNVKWVANDESGVEATMPFRFEQAVIPVTSITVTITDSDIEVGQTTAIHAEVLPANATNKGGTWSSSNESVATISGNVATAVGAGTATITRTAADGSGVTGSAALTVTAPVTP